MSKASIRRFLAMLDVFMLFNAAYGSDDNPTSSPSPSTTAGGRWCRDVCEPNMDGKVAFLFYVWGENHVV